MFMDEQFYDQNTIITHVSQRSERPSGLTRNLIRPESGGVSSHPILSSFFFNFFMFIREKNYG